MILRHPSETAGTGRRIERSRYTKPGDPPDNRRYCYQCGWPTNDDTDQEGDTIDSPGLSAQDTEITVNNDAAKLPQALNAEDFLVDSVTKTEMVRVGGCSFCGSYNREGRRRETFNSKDLSDL